MVDTKNCDSARFVKSQASYKLVCAPAATVPHKPEICCITYWSERNSKLYDGETSKALKRQNHACGHCGIKCTSEERVRLHHIDGNHNNTECKKFTSCV